MEHYKLLLWILIGGVWLYRVIKNSRDKNAVLPTPSAGPKTVASVKPVMNKKPILTRQFQKPNFTAVRPPTAEYKKLSDEAKGSAINRTRAAKEQAAFNSKNPVGNYDDHLQDEETIAKKTLADRQKLSRQVTAIDTPSISLLRAEKTGHADHAGIFAALKDTGKLRDAFVINEILKRKY